MRLVLLGKDRTTGMVGIYLPRENEEAELNMTIVNPRYVGTHPSYSYLFVIDPCIPEDLIIAKDPVELQGKPIAITSGSELRNSVAENLEGVVPYRSSASWTDLQKRIIQYASTEVQAERTKKEYDILLKRVEELAKQLVPEPTE